MENQSEPALPPIPEDVLLELQKRTEDGTIKWLTPDDPIANKIPPKYWQLDVNFLLKVIRAGGPAPRGLRIVSGPEIARDTLERAHRQLGEELDNMDLGMDPDDLQFVFVGIVRTLLGRLASLIEEEKGFLHVARAAFREVHGMPPRGPRPLKDQCFCAIDSRLGPSGHGFPPFHWVQRAHAAGLPIPYPFNDVSRPHIRPTMAELIRMIQEGVCDTKTGGKLPEPTARKYARLWERDTYAQKLTMSERWALHKSRSKAKKAHQ